MAQILVALIPFGYLITQWNALPERVPLHFSASGVADSFGSKNDLLVPLVMIFIVSIGTSLLINNLSKVDPKRSYTEASSVPIKISWTIIIFMSLIMCFIVYSVANYGKGEIISSKVVVLCICLLFATMGNFMNNIKPNYFVGIRTPWNLEDQENWRKTHYLGSKLWFFGGLILFVLILISPVTMTQYILFSGIFVLCVVPFVYSYRMFAAGKTSSPKDGE
jgi:uncharacterized membrane protein